MRKYLDDADVGLAALLAFVSELYADEATADDDDVFGVSYFVEHALQIGNILAHDEHVLFVRAGDREAHRQRAGGEDKLVVCDGFSIHERHGLLVPVYACGLISDKLDVVLAEHCIRYQVLLRAAHSAKDVRDATGHQYLFLFAHQDYLFVRMPAATAYPRHYACRASSNNQYICVVHYSSRFSMCSPSNNRTHPYESAFVFVERWACIPDRQGIQNSARLEGRFQWGGGRVAVPGEPGNLRLDPIQFAASRTSPHVCNHTGSGGCRRFSPDRLRLQCGRHAVGLQRGKFTRPADYNTPKLRKACMPTST